MFISQVIFESQTENKETLLRILEKKKTDACKSPGFVSAEAWWKESEASASFSLILRWEDEPAFKAWMKETHKGGHQKPKNSDFTITKTLYKFTSMDE